MNCREIFAANLTFDHAPRIGFALGGRWPSDVIHAGIGGSSTQPLEPRGHELRRWRDEWGVTWASLTDFDKGEVVEPAIADWADLDNWQPPALGEAGRYEAAAATFGSDREHFRIGHIPGFTFNVARKLRKLENYLCDLLLERGRIDELHRRVRGVLLEAIDRMAAAGADAIMFPEDWGTQDRLMVSPAMWREIYKPEFAALAGRAHDHGLKVIMHSCGKMTAVIDDMIETGVNCFQFDQPRLHGLELLAERFAGRAAFWCPVDIQTTLQTEDPAAIREDARLLIEKLFVRGGGFIAGRYPQDAALGLDPSIQDIACDAFVEFGMAPPR